MSIFKVAWTSDKNIIFMITQSSHDLIKNLYKFFHAYLRILFRQKRKTNFNMIILNLNRSTLVLLLRDVCIFVCYENQTEMAENNKKKSIFVRVVRSQM